MIMKLSKKQIIIISSVAGALVIGGVAAGVTSGVIANLDAKYNEALTKLINQENTEAYLLFNELGNYKDSNVKRAYSYELMSYEQGEKDFEGMIDNVINNNGKVEVCFDTNSGTFIDNRVIDEKADPYITERAFKSYHDFSKWDLTFAKYDKDNDYISIKIDALYTDHNYAIVYHLNGGALDVSAPLHYTYYTDDLLIPYPEKTGYSFKGYKSDIYEEENPVKDYVIRKGSSGDIELTAFYEANDYLMNFDPLDGTCPTTSGYFTYDKDYTNNFPVAHKDYYTFDGWYYNDVLVDKTCFNIAVNNATLVAKYSPIEYTITYELDGGKLLGDTIHSINYETPATAIPFASKDGYVFTGWKLNDSEPDIHFKTPEHTHENITLVATYAQYQASASDEHVFAHLINGNTIKQLVLPAHITSIEDGLKGSLLSNMNTIDAEPGSIFEMEDEFLILPRDNGRELHFAPYARFNNSDTLTIPDGITHIGDEVFENFHINHVNATASLHYLGDYAFHRSYLIDLTGADLYEIGKQAFRECDNLSDSIIENNAKITSIGDQAFYKCVAFRTVHLRETLKTVKDSVFAEIPLLETVNYECDTLIQIKDNAFRDDSNIKNVKAKVVTISKVLELLKDAKTSIKNIEVTGSGAFSDEQFKNYSALETITFTDTSFNAITTSCFENDTNLKDITIPSSVTTISSKAFKNSGLENITFEDASNLKTIYNGSFDGTHIKSIDLSPAKSLQIEDGAFANIGALEEVSVQYNAMESFKAAFENCPNIKKISLYLDQTSIQSFDLAERYFSGLAKLEEVELVFLSKEVAYNPVDIVLPYSCFSGCSSLVDITLYNCKIEEIGEYAFENCYKFTNANKNVDGLNVYPRGCFFGCTELQVDITGATEIGRYAFVLCNNLGEFTIPSTVITVGVEAFAYAFGNISLHVDYTKASIDAMNVVDGNWYNWDMNCFCPITYKS